MPPENTAPSELTQVRSSEPKPAAPISQREFPRESPIERIPNEQRRKLYSDVESTIALMHTLEPTALSLAKLHIFNTLTSDPSLSLDSWNREMKKLYRWSAEEAEASRPDNLLPTIGIEIESRQDYFGPAIEETFDRFGIYHYDDIIGGRRVDEVAPHYSYDARTSARLVHEMVELGAFPLVAADGKRIVPEEVMLGLHVNIGIAERITPELLHYTKEMQELNLINGFISIAFASANRIRRRGRSLAPRGLRINRASESKKAALGDREDNGPYRIELRAMELRASSVYRMLAEVQNIMAAFFAHVKLRNQLSLSDQERALAESWPAFHSSVETMLHSYSEILKSPQAIDQKLEEIAVIMETTDIQTAARSIIANYSRQLGSLIQQENPKDISLTMNQQ